MPGQGAGHAFSLHCQLLWVTMRPKPLTYICETCYHHAEYQRVYEHKHMQMLHTWTQPAGK